MRWLIEQIVPTTPFHWVTMLVQAFTWPAVALILARMFRREVRHVLDRLVRLKFQDFEARFERDLRESEALASQSEQSRRLIDAPSSSRPIIPELNQPGNSVPRASVNTPRTVIEEAWATLAQAADRVAGETSVDPIGALVDRAIVDGPVLRLFERLRQLSSQVARHHEWEPSPGAASRYADLAQSLAQRLER